MARTWAEIEALGLTPAEQALIDDCKAGRYCELGATRPARINPKWTIRAEVLKYLILGGCDACRVDEWGVELYGAWISGPMDISLRSAKGITKLENCHFTHRMDAMQTKFRFLNLSGSYMLGLNAQGAQIEGSVFLRGGFRSDGLIDINMATIGGQLDCTDGRFMAANDIQGRHTGLALNAQGTQVTGTVSLSRVVTKGIVRLSNAVVGGQVSCEAAHFSNPHGQAINAQGVKVRGGLYLRKGFKAEGAVHLSSAEIGGQLDCSGGSFKAAVNIDGDPACPALNTESARIEGSVFLRQGFNAEGEVRLSGTAIGGVLDCRGGTFADSEAFALRMDDVQVNGRFSWNGARVIRGNFSLESARVGDLADDLESWPDGGRLIFDGFTYDRISAFTDSVRRLDWLQRGTVWKGEFHPQPYAQLARVLREMGHERAARDVRVKQGRLIRWYDRQRAHQALNGDWGPAVRGFWADLLWLGSFWSLWVVGYGYRPFLSLAWLLAFWVVSVVLAEMAWRTGAMVPNSGAVLTSPEWLALWDSSHPANYWTAQGAPGQDWERFNRYAWGIDVVVPALNLGQTESWIPSATRGNWGFTAWWAWWLLSALGWIVVALAAAAVTGIIQRKD